MSVLLSVNLEIIIFILVFCSIVVNAIVVSKFGKSVLGIIFLYFLIGTTLLGAIFAYIFAFEAGIINVEESTEVLGWHIIFFLAMTMYTIAGTRLVQFATKGEIVESYQNVITWALFSLLTLVALFVGAPFVDTPFHSFFVGSIWNRFGIHHFIAFALAGFVSIKLLRFYSLAQQGLGKIVSHIVPPMIVVIALLSLQHLWELLTESWEIIILPSETIEKVEQYIMLPAFVVLLLGFLRLKRLLDT